MDGSHAYRSGETLHEGRHGGLCSGVRRSDGREVVLKAYLHRSPEAEGEAEREFAALRKVAGPGVVAALELIREANRTVLVLERVHGPTLKRWVGAKGPLGPAPFLELAIQLASSLSRVQAARLIHGAVHPRNILVEPETLRACLVDFSVARPLGSAANRGELKLEGARIGVDLHYFSPEQTGRMDRGVDSRSDLYSLGATLYFALTGQPPFLGDDPLALVHAHLARLPQDPRELRPEIPPALACIVLRLLQKSPQDRYQMAGALERDLRRCKDELERTGTIAGDFALGNADAPHCPIFSQRLYGRDGEIATLQACYEEASTGRPVLLFVEGAGGLGKSALMQSLRSALARTHGYLAQGKFDAYRRDQPYLGVAHALQWLFQQLLTESDARLKDWSQQLTEGLGASAAALVELVPDLGLVLGEIPRATALGPLETRLRLTRTVQRLMQVMATPEHPLVLFIDDVQWADPASRDLLSDILERPANLALLLVCAYRDDEVDTHHPLMQLRGSPSADFPVRVITLRPLGDEACAAMLADALGRSPEEVRSLAACVGRKTGNAPLLIQQFVYHLYDERLLTFAPEVGWSWSEEALEAAQIPESAVGLLTARIFRLPHAVAEVLKLASCLSAEFDQDFLQELTDVAHTPLGSALATLCDEGLLAPSQQGFRFAHDRIREAAQAMLSTHDRARLHGRAAEFLLEHTSGPELDLRIFEIADHLNAATQAGTTGDRQRVLEINVRACKRALGAGAGATAFHYFRAAQAHLDESFWESQPGICFDLFLQGADAAHQCKEFAEAERCLDLLAARRLSQIQSVHVLARQIRNSSVTRPRLATVDLTLRLLRRFGVRWSRSPSRLRLWFEMLRTDLHLRRARDGELLEPCKSEDVDRVVPMLLIQAAGQSLSMTSYRLVLLGTALTLRLYATFGFLASPSMALAAYGAYQLRFARRRLRAIRCIDAARRWNERHPARTYGPRSEMIALAYGDAWLRPRHELIAPLRRVSLVASEEGDFEYACLSDALRLTLMSFIGVPIPEQQLEREQVGWTSWAYALSSARFLGSRVFAMLTEGAPVDDALSEISRAQSAPEIHLYTTVQSLLVLAVLGEHERVHDAAESICAQAYRAQIGTQIADFSFLRGWAAGAVARSASGARRRAARRALRRSLRDLRRWAHPGSDFVHMFQLLEAERLRSRGKTNAALALYAKAADDALAHKHLHNAALGHEARAELLEELGRSTEARTSLRRAMHVYEEWGAVAKVRSLESRLAGA